MGPGEAPAGVKSGPRRVPDRPPPPKSRCQLAAEIAWWEVPGWPPRPARAGGRRFLGVPREPLSLALMPPGAGRPRGMVTPGTPGAGVDPWPPLRRRHCLGTSTP
ncbi:hypothetical protein BJX61DRAFT_500873 [Aspergillus egyptiacus]|nr:hypothetical protein BJX61DRAFT_500873 [Aspergillus egyptiacus]